MHALLSGLMRLPLIVAAGLFAAGLAACSSSGSSTTPVAVATAVPSPVVRVLNGSPNAGAVDVRIDSATALPIAAALPYQGFTGFGSTTASTTHTVYVTAAGGTTALLQCPFAAFGGQSYTIVVAGSTAIASGTAGALQCQIGVEPIYSIPSGQYALVVHHASPALDAQKPAVDTVSFGTFPPGTTTYSAPLANVIFNPTLNNGSGNLGTTPTLNNGVTTAPGVGFWFAASTTTAPTTVITTILPSQGFAGKAGQSGASDTSNILPTGVLTRFSVYLIDGPGATTRAIGLFD